MIDFIDPLFAVVLNVSFAQIMQEKWFFNFCLIYRHPTGFQVATLLFVGYLSVVLSWVGYHRSIINAPISVETLAGLFRFILDVGLLLLYLILLTGFKSPRRQVWCLACIYLGYFVWDQLKRKERPEADSPERRGVTVFWLLFFMLVAVTYEVVRPGETNWVVLGLMFVGTILYRAHKTALWFPGVLKILGYPPRRE